MNLYYRKVFRELQGVRGIKIPIDVYMASSLLFDVHAHSYYRSNKRLMLDIRAMQKSYERFEIRSLHHVSGKPIPAYELTKAVAGEILLELAEGRLDHTVEQYVTRHVPMHNFGRTGRGVNRSDRQRRTIF